MIRITLKSGDEYLLDNIRVEDNRVFYQDYSISFDLVSKVELVIIPEAWIN